MQKRTTISDIAREAGVNKSTVSIVLNRHPLSRRIAENTKKRIIEASEKLNYLPSLVAKALTSGKTGTLGMVVGDIKSPYFAELTDAALQAADDHGYQMLVSVTKWDIQKESRALKTLMQRQVDGIILCMQNLNHDHKLYNEIRSINYPIVIYGQGMEGFSSVSSDFTSAMDELVETFQQNGYNSIVFIDYVCEPTAKELSFSKACQKYGVKAKKLILPDFSNEAIMEIAKEIAVTEHSHAYLVFSDYYAIRLASYLMDLGKKVFEDIMIMGIDGTTWASFFRPSFPIIHQNRTLMMSEAVKILIEKGKNKLKEPENIAVPAKLIMNKIVNRTIKRSYKCCLDV